MSILEKMFTKNTITYIANAGVMICVKNKKIIIDGVIGEGDYYGPEEDFIDKLVLGNEPYHNIDYIFVTHSHKDHINPLITNELLKRNRHVKVIGPTAVKRAIMSERNYNDVLSPQLMTVFMKNHSRMDISLGDISFSSFRLPHDGTHHSTLENIAYHIYADGVTILALGDAAPRMHDFEMCNIPEKCDILICHANYIGQKSGREIISMLKPKHLALCHIKDDERQIARINALCEKYKKDLPKTVSILTTPGETIKI